jgi:hypothetical protein
MMMSVPASKPRDKCIRCGATRLVPIEFTAVVTPGCARAADAVSCRTALPAPLAAEDSSRSFDISKFVPGDWAIFESLASVYD